MKSALRLVPPAHEYLPGYVDALQRGWSPDNIRGAAATEEQLANIAADATMFLDRLVDRDALGPRIGLPDGSTVKRLPGYSYWLWDGEFCGTINLRWQPGTSDLPPHVLGHIGYAVVSWKRGRGYGSAALGMLLPHARSEGLNRVEITTDADNFVSQRVILANGGVLVEAFRKPPQFGGKDSLRFRIEL